MVGYLVHYIIFKYPSILRNMNNNDGGDVVHSYQGVLLGCYPLAMFKAKEIKLKTINWLGRRR